MNKATSANETGTFGWYLTYKAYKRLDKHTQDALRQQRWEVRIGQTDYDLFLFVCSGCPFHQSRNWKSRRSRSCTHGKRFLRLPIQHSWRGFIVKGICLLLWRWGRRPVSHPMDEARWCVRSRAVHVQSDMTFQDHRMSYIKSMQWLGSTGECLHWDQKKTEIFG